MEARKKILFSCVGTTDPVRGLRDGPMLHIMRHYRPDVVCTFITDEMARFEEADDRYRKAIDFARSHWEGYEVEYIPVYSKIRDAHDLDVLAQPIYDAVDNLCEKYPDAELLLNLTSGTPQMQIIMAQMALDIRYRAIGIQVENPERKAGTTTRTNARDYDVDAELELNEDELADQKNRTAEPEMLSLQRAKQLDRIQALLDERDYAAVRSMKGSLPAPLMTLVSHLAVRSQLQTDEARRLAKAANVPFQLYPMKKDLSRSIKDYQEVSEYFLMLKNMQQGHRYTDFVVRLNPLVIRLQCAALNRWLGFPLKDILQARYGVGQQLSVCKLKEKAPQLYTDLNKCMEQRGLPPVDDRDLSIFMCNRMLECLPDVPQDILDFFNACEVLNRKRNAAAHDLTYITDDNIRQQCGLNSAQIVKKIQQILPVLYPECDPEIFTIYQRCNQYIMDNARPTAHKT